VVEVLAPALLGLLFLLVDQAEAELHVLQVVVVALLVTQAMVDLEQHLEVLHLQVQVVAVVAVVLLPQALAQAAAE
jgi:hypothetical protein